MNDFSDGACTTKSKPPVKLLSRVAHAAETFVERVHGKIQRYRDSRFGPRKRSNLTIGRAYESGWKGYDAVFVLSTGRTGTATLARLLGLSSAVQAEHEAIPQLVKASFDAYMDTSPNWEERWSRVLLAARDDHVLNANAEGKIYVETNYRLTYLSRAIVQSFPESKFIFLHRDPHKVIRSGMRRGYYHGLHQAWNFARIRPRQDDVYFEEWDGFSPLQKLAWRWARVNDQAADFFLQLPASRRMELPSKDLFSGSVSVLDRIFDFVGVELPEAHRIERVLNKRINAQDHYDGNDFEWTDEKREKVRPIVKDTAERLDYQV